MQAIAMAALDAHERTCMGRMLLPVDTRVAPHALLHGLMCDDRGPKKRDESSEGKAAPHASHVVAPPPHASHHRAIIAPQLATLDAHVPVDKRVAHERPSG
jgi:hypothetical protein